MLDGILPLIVKWVFACLGFVGGVFIASVVVWDLHLVALTVKTVRLTVKTVGFSILPFAFGIFSTVRFTVHFTVRFCGFSTVAYLFEL